MGSKQLRDKYYFFSAALSILLLAAILYFSDISEVFTRIYSANPLLLSTGFILGNIPLVLSAYNWKIIFRETDVQNSLKTMISLKLSCVFLSNLTPFGDMGGEPLVAKLISDRYETSYSAVLPRIAVVDTVQNIPYIFFGFLNLAIIGLNTEKMFLNRLISSKTVLTSSLLGFLPTEKLGFYIEGFRQILKTYFENLNDLIENPRLGFKLVSISFLRFCFDVLCVLTVTYSLGVDVAFWSLFLVIPVARIANLMPSLGGLGAYEAGFSGLLVLVSGVSMTEAVSVSIVYRSITTYFGLIAGFLTINRVGLLQIYKSVTTKTNYL